MTHTVKATRANTRPLSHLLTGYHEVLIPELVLEWYREHPARLGQLVLDCVDSNLAPFFLAPLYDGEEEDE